MNNVYEIEKHGEENNFQNAKYFIKVDQEQIWEEMRILLSMFKRADGQRGFQR